MTEEELAFWREFFRVYPFDDLHRYYRPIAYLASRTAGPRAQQAVDAALAFLQPAPKQPARSLRPARVIRGPA